MKAGARGDLQGLRGIEEAGQEIGALLDALMPPGWGFVLLAAQHGAAGYMTYVSSLDRSAIPTLLRESAVQLEQGADRPPGRLGREH